MPLVTFVGSSHLVVHEFTQVVVYDFAYLLFFLWTLLLLLLLLLSLLSLLALFLSRARFGCLMIRFYDGGIPSKAAAFAWPTEDPTHGKMYKSARAIEHRIPFDAAGLVCTIRPMEVRTFIVRLA